MALIAASSASSSCSRACGRNARVRDVHSRSWRLPRHYELPGANVRPARRQGPLATRLCGLCAPAACAVARPRRAWAATCLGVLCSQEGSTGMHYRNRFQGSRAWRSAGGRLSASAGERAKPRGRHAVVRRGAPSVSGAGPGAASGAHNKSRVLACRRQAAMELMHPCRWSSNHSRL